VGKILSHVSILICLLAFPVDLTAASKPSDGRSELPSQGSTPNPGYRLGANDLIKVQVFGEESLNTETRVSGDGKISIPLLGILEIKGLTVKETEELIAKRLADGYIYSTKYRNFFVSGEVKTPGGYPYEDGLTVLKAVTLAGGFTNKASPSRVKIKRLKDNKEEETISAKLHDPVFPDDVIVVPESFF